MSKRAKVLIVDDEPSIVMGLLRTLYKDNKLYDVLLASDAEVGQALLRELDISILITDLNLPGMSGMDLLCWTATERPYTQLIIITALNIEQIKGQAYHLGCLRIFQKPFDLEKIRELVLSLLHRKNSQPSGHLSGLSVADMLQMLCLGKRSSALHLTYHDHAGVLFLQDGEIIHALWHDLQGEEALFKILQTKDCLFRLMELPPDPPRSIHNDWQFLLMEGMRREDEENAGFSPLVESFGDAPLSPFPSSPDLSAFPLSGSFSFSKKPPLSSLPASPPSPPHDTPFFDPSFFHDLSKKTVSSDSDKLLEHFGFPPSPPSKPEPSSKPEIQAKKPALASSSLASSSLPSSSLPSSSSPKKPASSPFSPSPAPAKPASPSPEKEIARLTERGFEALRQGGREQAKILWEEALRLDPENKTLQVNLKKLHDSLKS